MRHATRFADLLRKRGAPFVILGPAPAAIPKIQSEYRWHIVVKDAKGEDPGGQSLHHVLSGVRKEYDSSAPGKNKAVRLIIDVDPAGMM